MNKVLLNGKLGADGSYNLEVVNGNVEGVLSFENAELKASVSITVKTIAGLELLKPHLPVWAQGAIPLIEAALGA